MSDSRRIKVPRSLLDFFSADKEIQSFFKDMESRTIIGELYGSAKTVTITVADTFYALTGLTKGIQDRTVVDASAGTITVQTVGKYLVNCAAYFYGAANTAYYGNVFVNGVAQDKLYFVDRTITTADVESASMTAFLSLYAGDVVSFKVSSTSGPVDITFATFSLNISAQA